MGLEVGLLGLVLLLLVVWAMLQIFQSQASTLSKVIWIVVLLIFPFVGFIAWLIFGPRANR